MGLFASCCCSQTKKKKMEKPQSSRLFCGLDNVSHAECPGHPRLLHAVPPASPSTVAAASLPHQRGKAMLLLRVQGGKTEGHTGENGRTDSSREWEGEQAPQQLRPERKEPACSRGLQQECSQAFRSAVGQRSKFDAYFPSSAIHIAPNLIPIRYTEAAAKELL